MAPALVAVAVDTVDETSVLPINTGRLPVMFM